GEVVERLLALKPCPTALFIWHDRLAYQILEALAERNLDVPGDLSVVGYDGLTWPSTTHHVVTSVQTSFEAMADAAVSSLIRLVEGKPGPLHQAVPVAFVPGTTLGSPSQFQSKEGKF
ncbi:MAG: LacI family transcriptional regulator, partial [Verrucomicrobiaceae bacterium]